MKLLNKIYNWYLNKESLPYWLILFADIMAFIISILFVSWLFLSTNGIISHYIVIIRTICLYMVFNLISFRIFHTYSGILRYSSFIDLQRIAYAMVLAFFMVVLVHYPILLYDYNVIANSEYIFLHYHIKHIFPIYLMATILMWTMRIMIKVLYDAYARDDAAQRVLIYGIKDGGIGLAKNIRNQSPARYILKGFISHEKVFQNRILMGEKVYASDKNLLEIIKKLRVKAVLVSPLRNDDFRNNVELQNLLIEARIHILMSPTIKEWKRGYIEHLKEISIEDLLPRDEINVNLQEIGEILKGKRIMITGSAGSIGSEIVRQIANFMPAELILIDQAETPQHDIRLMVSKKWANIKTYTIVASISNKERMEQIFRKLKPEYVIHAAAYKHVPMMENNPSESIQNNILGTKVIADLSVKYGVDKVVMISTDKAVNPTNVMGCSKRICEIYVQSLDKAIKDGVVSGNTHFITTRFGNVLGSNGSVIPLFEKQIKDGGPVTVTDPNIIRFFMLISEACKLVLEAGTHGKGGEIFVFDMGKPVRIVDLAKRMILLSGANNIKIEYTGLRSGEKLYEEVLSNEENTIPSFHKKIRIAKTIDYDYKAIERNIEELINISYGYNDMKIVAKMKDIVPEFISKNSIYSSLDTK